MPHSLLFQDRFFIKIILEKKCSFKKAPVPDCFGYFQISLVQVCADAIARVVLSLLKIDFLFSVVERGHDKLRYQRRALWKEYGMCNQRGCFREGAWDSSTGGAVAYTFYG